MSDKITTFVVKGLSDMHVAVPREEKEVMASTGSSLISFSRISEPGKPHECAYSTQDDVVIKYLRKLIRGGHIVAREDVRELTVTCPHCDFTAPNTPEGQALLNEEHLKTHYDDEGELINVKTRGGRKTANKADPPDVPADPNAGGDQN